MDSLDLVQGGKCNVVGYLGAGLIRRPLIVGVDSDRHTFDAAVNVLRAVTLQLSILHC